MPSTASEVGSGVDDVGIGSPLTFASVVKEIRNKLKQTQIFIIIPW